MRRVQRLRQPFPPFTRSPAERSGWLRRQRSRPLAFAAPTVAPQCHKVRSLRVTVLTVLVVRRVRPTRLWVGCSTGRLRWPVLLASSRAGGKNGHNTKVQMTTALQIESANRGSAQRLQPNPSVEATSNSVALRAGQAGFAHSACPARSATLSAAPHFKR